MPPLLDYTTLVPPAPTTRAVASDSCSCKICEIARKSLNYIAYKADHSNKLGRPPLIQSPHHRKPWQCAQSAGGKLGKEFPITAKNQQKGKIFQIL